MRAASLLPPPKQKLVSLRKTARPSCPPSRKVKHRENRPPNFIFTGFLGQQVRTITYPFIQRWHIGCVLCISWFRKSRFWSWLPSLMRTSWLLTAVLPSAMRVWVATFRTTQAPPAAACNAWCAYVNGKRRRASTWGRTAVFWRTVVLRSQPLCVFWASCFQSACSFHISASEHIMNENDSILGLFFVDFWSLQRLVCLQKKDHHMMYPSRKTQLEAIVFCWCFYSENTVRPLRINSNKN